LISKALRH
jgi:hypothetical protein